MENTFETEPVRERDIHYYRQRFKNRVFEKLVSFYVQEAKARGITKKQIAERLRRDPSLITRWLSSPSNLTLESVSDLLLALNAEPEPPQIGRFADKVPTNYAHPLLEKILGRIPLPEPQKYQGIETLRIDSSSGATTTGISVQFSGPTITKTIGAVR